jgi:hypothetical protein
MDARAQGSSWCFRTIHSLRMHHDFALFFLILGRVAYLKRPLSVRLCGSTATATATLLLRLRLRYGYATATLLLRLRLLLRLLHNFHYYGRLLRNPNTGTQTTFTKRGLYIVIAGLYLVKAGLYLTSPITNWLPINNLPIKKALRI